MLVVGIGYILFAQIFFVVIVVGLGGAVVLVSANSARVVERGSFTAETYRTHCAE
jgi:hypothetical protein